MDRPRNLGPQWFALAAGGGGQSGSHSECHCRQTDPDKQPAELAAPSL
jgi:hypothetical protein